ncbi:MAG: phosphoribosylanthranilate isomerase [Phycisphaerales bacterium]|nr:phosphoribosylanthranilate isomerase [Phycisphaerales bacterium]
MATWIKICGLTNLEDAALAARLGADALGFVLHRGSSRFCAPSAARAIIGEVPHGVTTIGVWFDESVEVVSEAARFIGCNLVQIYDPMTARVLHAHGFDILPAIPVAGEAIGREDWRRFCESWLGRVVVDRSRAIPERATPAHAPEGDAWRDLVSTLGKTQRVVLAGGLSPENIRAALDTYRPLGVDVASGVESAPGRKDPKKLARFIEEVRRWDAKVGSDGSAGSLSPRP